jgi:phosphonate transport system permease protein
MTENIPNDTHVALKVDNPLRPKGVVLKKIVIFFAAASLIGAGAIHVLFYGVDWSRTGGLADMIETASWFIPDFAYFPHILVPLFDTLLIAFWGTILAAFLTLPIAYLSAQNITPFFPVSYVLGRSIMVLSRSIHELIFALLFVSALGLGAFPGILALACRSVGFLSKTTAEAVENINQDSVEAIKATGANRISVIIYGIIPQVFPIFIGNLVFLAEINLRRAAILGMVGAGGIGFIFEERIMELAYDRAGTIVLGVVIMVILGEYFSNRIRDRLI